MKKKYNTEEERKEATRLRGEKYRENNPDYNKNYHKDNALKERELMKKWHKANPNYAKEAKRKWREANPNRDKELMRKSRQNNPQLFAWRDILKNSLKRLGKSKEEDTIDLLGYSALDLHNHMISLFTDGMSWSNYGEWHIDHIKAVYKFDKDTHPSIVNALSNLQPLWATTREINGIIYEGNLNKNKF